MKFIPSFSKSVILAAFLSWSLAFLMSEETLAEISNISSGSNTTEEPSVEQMLPALENLGFRRKGDQIIADLSFDQRFAKPQYSVELINETVQINIVGARLREGKRNLKVQDNLLRNIYVYQASENTLRCRLIYHKGFSVSDLKDHIGVQIKNQGIQIVVNTPQNLANPTKKLPVYPPVSFSDAHFSNESEVFLNNDDSAEMPLEAGPSAGSDDDLEKAAVLLARELDRPPSGPQVQSGASEKPAPKSEVLSKTSVKSSVDNSESDIAVFKSVGHKRPSSSSAWDRMLWGLLSIALAAGGVFYLLRKWQKQNRSQKQSTHIRVKNQHYLSPKKSLAIIEVAGESILIGITDHTISHLKTLSPLDDELNAMVPQNFENTLSRAESITPEPHEEEEFTMGGLKDLVQNKLKGMRIIS